ncbi:hypothetical protein [Paenibacillus glucanolyticus]|nr:hypothetical protein [Paenibacillus glucanolyticus]
METSMGKNPILLSFPDMNEVSESRRTAVSHWKVYRVMSTPMIPADFLT